MPLQQKTKKPTSKKHTPSKPPANQEVVVDFLSGLQGMSAADRLRHVRSLSWEMSNNRSRFTDKDIVSIVNSLMVSDKSSKVRREALNALGTVKDDQAVTILKKYALDERDTVIVNLQSMATKKSIDAFLDLYKDKTIRQFWNRLVTIDSPYAQKQFVDLVCKESNKDDVTNILSSFSNSVKNDSLMMDILQKTDNYNLAINNQGNDYHFTSRIRSLINNEEYKDKIDKCLITNPKLISLYEGSSRFDIKDQMVTDINEKITNHSNAFQKSGIKTMRDTEKLMQTTLLLLKEYPELYSKSSYRDVERSTDPKNIAINKKYVKSVAPIVGQVFASLDKHLPDKRFLSEVSDFLYKLPLSSEIMAEVTKNDKDAVNLNKVMDYFASTIETMDNPLEKYKYVSPHEKGSVLVPTAQIIQKLLIENVSMNEFKESKGGYSNKERREALQRLLGEKGNGLGLVYGQLCADYRLFNDYPENREFKDFTNSVRKAILLSSDTLDEMVKINKTSFEKHGRKYDGNKFWYMDKEVEFYGNIKAISDFMDETAKAKKISPEKTENIVTNLLYYTSKNIDFINYSGSINRKNMNPLLRKLNFTKKDMDRFIRSVFNFGQTYSDLQE